MVTMRMPTSLDSEQLEHPLGLLLNHLNVRSMESSQDTLEMLQRNGQRFLKRLELG